MTGGITIETIALGFAGFVLMWLIRVVMEVRDDMRDLKGWANGTHGSKGIQQTLEELEKYVKDVSATVTHCQVSHGIISSLRPSNTGL